MRFSLAIAAILLLAGCATMPRSVTTEPLPPGTLFSSLRPAQVQTLVFVVENELTAGTETAHLVFAQQAATILPNSAAIALPGADRSAGSGGGYTAQAVAQLADTVGAWRRRYPGAQTVLVGEGGGAALVAILAGTRPSQVDAMLLLSCPCTLPEWRKHMVKQRPGTGFDQRGDSLDPLQIVGGISTNTRTAIVVGDDDVITPPRFARTYAEALALRGIAVDFRVVPGKGHGLLNDPEVFETLARLAAPVARTAARR